MARQAVPAAAPLYGTPNKHPNQGKAKQASRHQMHPGVQIMMGAQAWGTELATDELTSGLWALSLELSCAHT